MALALTMTHHLITYLIMGNPRENRTMSLNEGLQWSSLVNLRLVHDGRLVCDLMDRDSRVNVLSIYGCRQGKRVGASFNFK